MRGRPGGGQIMEGEGWGGGIRDRVHRSLLQENSSSPRMGGMKWKPEKPVDTHLPKKSVRKPLGILQKPTGKPEEAVGKERSNILESRLSRNFP